MYQLFSSAVSGLSNDFRLVAGSCGNSPGDRSEGVCARGWDWQDHGTCGCPRAGTGPALQTAACIQRISSDADSPEPDRGQLCCRHSWADGGLFNLYNVSGISSTVSRRRSPKPAINCCCLVVIHRSSMRRPHRLRRPSESRIRFAVAPPSPIPCSGSSV